MYDNDVGDRATLAMVNYEKRQSDMELKLRLELRLELRLQLARVEEPFDLLDIHDYVLLHGQS